MRFRLLAGTVFSTFTLAIGAAHAQTAPVDVADVADDDQQREQVTVTATRTEKRLDEVAATVTVISAERIENELATDIKDVVRFVPGVSVRNAPARFGAALGTTGRDGNAGFNIRGLDGNRVLIVVDGVRMPDAYTFGAQAQGRGDYQDLDMMKSVEILRGPSSALYGSDGIAGVVNFITRDPGDIVQDDRMFGLRARSSYASADDSLANSLMAATEFGQWSAMLAYTGREGSEQENKGTNYALNSTRTAPNPTDYESQSYLGKVVWEPTDTQRLRFTYERSDRDTTYEVYSGRAVPLPVPPNAAPYAATGVIDLDASDTSDRERFSFDHVVELGDGFFGTLKWNAYTQWAKTRQFTFEDRYTAADRIRDTTFDNRISGASGQIDGDFETGGAQHHYVFGAEYSQLSQSSIRTGTVPPAGESFPARPFPTTEYTLAGAYLADEITLFDGVLVVYPALRFDSYELDPQRDALYPSSQPAAASDDTHVSPKLGVVAWPSDHIGAFINYSAGYKAPTPSQVNNGFFNPLQNYTSIANTDLRPETSDGVEGGVRFRDMTWLGANWAGEVTAFVTDAKDFIDQTQISGSFTPTDPAVFQYNNLSNVSINGVEARFDAHWDNGLGLNFAAAQAAGEQRVGSATSPLQSINPLNVVAGVSYADPEGRFGGQVIATYSDAKQNKDILENQTGNSAADLFSPRSFILLDITAYWNITEWAALRVGAFNVTDEKYWWWSDVRGVLASSGVKDAYTMPGANYSASLTLRY